MEAIGQLALNNLLQKGSDFMSGTAAREIAPTSADTLSSLEQKVYRTIELLKVARSAKLEAERDAARLREQIETREEELDSLRNENLLLRKEREDVRARVEKLLEQIEGLAE
jgi:chromosome segregation ATPase